MIPVSLECTGPRQRNSKGLVFILERQPFSMLLCRPGEVHGNTRYYHTFDQKCMNEEHLYLENHATYKNKTCTVTFTRACTFQRCRSTVGLICSSVFQRHPSAPKTGTATKIRRAAAGTCCSPIVQKSCREMLYRKNRKRCPIIYMIRVVDCRINHV